MNGSLGECSDFPVTDPPTSQDEFSEGEQSAKLWDCDDLPWGTKIWSTKIWSTQHGSPGQHLHLTQPFILKCSTPSGRSLVSPRAVNGKASRTRAAAPRGLSSASGPRWQPHSPFSNKARKASIQACFSAPSQSSCVDDKAGRGRVETSC